ncbi:MAG: BON domain-containing protein [Gemmataceae bacterium]|nr:BON domain-containing protein [Gemmataceae bacterium]
MTAILVPHLAEDALRQSAIPAIRRLTLNEDETEVVLQGVVSSYYMKQLAQEAVLPVLGQRKLRNLIAVVKE